MARRDGWPQQSREVWIWVLPLHVGQFPRGACPRCRLDAPQIARCLPPSSEGTGGEGRRGGASARKSRPHPLSAQPLCPAPPYHAQPLDAPAPLCHRAQPLPGSPGSAPSAKFLSFPAMARALVGFPELLRAQPRPSWAWLRPLCQPRLFPASAALPRSASKASESSAPPLTLLGPASIACPGSSQLLPAPRFGSPSFPSRLSGAESLSPLSLEGGGFLLGEKDCSRPRA